MKKINSKAWMVNPQVGKDTLKWNPFVRQTKKGINLSGPPLKAATNMEKAGADKGQSPLRRPKKGALKCSNSEQRERIRAVNATPLPKLIYPNPDPKSKRGRPKKPKAKTQLTIDKWVISNTSCKTETGKKFSIKSPNRKGRAQFLNQSGKIQIG